MKKEITQNAIITFDSDGLDRISFEKTSKSYAVIDYDTKKETFNVIKNRYGQKGVYRKEENPVKCPICHIFPKVEYDEACCKWIIGVSREDFLKINPPSAHLTISGENVQDLISIWNKYQQKPTKSQIAKELTEKGK